MFECLNLKELFLYFYYSSLLSEANEIVSIIQWETEFFIDRSVV